MVLLLLPFRLNCFLPFCFGLPRFSFLKCRDSFAFPFVFFTTPFFWAKLTEAFFSRFEPAEEEESNRTEADGSLRAITADEITEEVAARSSLRSVFFFFRVFFRHGWSFCNVLGPSEGTPGSASSSVFSQPGLSNPTKYGFSKLQDL